MVVTGATVASRRAAVGASLLLSLVLVRALVSTVTVGRATVRTSLLLALLLLVLRLLVLLLLFGALVASSTVGRTTIGASLLLRHLLLGLLGGLALLLDGLGLELVEGQVARLGLDNLVEALLLGALLLLDVLNELVDVLGLLRVSVSSIVLGKVVSELLVSVALKVALRVLVLVGGVVKHNVSGDQRQLNVLNLVNRSGNGKLDVSISDTGLKGSGNGSKRKEENGLDLHCSGGGG